AWRDRFVSNRDRACAMYDERFCRMWEFYLTACEVGFLSKELNVFQIQLAKDLDAVPETRDYIHQFEAAH
ncbi:MAG: class I SAM-dependent methyltransferase, partial [Alphaproteobacteria bacterium]|nr:class I SAM-dependent methyltransferase [Alphaproteobacteria bacterium]